MRNVVFAVVSISIASNAIFCCVFFFFFEHASVLRRYWIESDLSWRRCRCTRCAIWSMTRTLFKSTHSLAHDSLSHSFTFHLLGYQTFSSNAILHSLYGYFILFILKFCFRKKKEKKIQVMHITHTWMAIGCTMLYITLLESSTKRHNMSRDGAFVCAVCVRCRRCRNHQFALAFHMKNSCRLVSRILVEQLNSSPLNLLVQPIDRIHS